MKKRYMTPSSCVLHVESVCLRQNSLPKSGDRFTDEVFSRQSDDCWGEEKRSRGVYDNFEDEEDDYDY